MSAELYNAVSLIVVVLIVAGMALYMNRALNNLPFAYAMDEHRVNSAEHDFKQEIARLRAAFDAVLEENHRLMAKVENLEGQVSVQEDQIKALRREVEEWRLQARGTR